MSRNKQLARLRGMTAEELSREELELRQEIWKLRLQQNGGQLEGPHKVRQARRNLARVLTLARAGLGRPPAGGR